MSAGLSIAAGLSTFFGYPILHQGAVLYIAAEGGGMFQYRILAWCDEHGVDEMEIPFRVLPMPVNLRDPEYQKELLAIIEEIRPVLVVVDTLSRCAPGAEENSARDMGEVVSFCTLLQTKTHAAVTFVHHPAKSDPGGSGRGSGVIFGAIDTEIRVLADDEGEPEPDGTRHVLMTCAKQKDDMMPSQIALRGSVVNVRNFAHESGRAITTLVVRSEDADYKPEKKKKKEEQQAQEHEQKVLQAIAQHQPKSQQALRGLVGLGLDKTAAALHRLIHQGLVADAKRGEAYTVTEAGKKKAADPF